MNLLLGFVKKIERLSKCRNISIEELCEEINSMDQSVFKSFLPKFDFFKPSAIRYADVYKDESVHMNIFGFLRSGQRIPLHNHPNMFACMKVLQGSFRINSYTIIERTHNKVLTRYDGFKCVSSNDSKHTIFLEPKKGNIHEIIALEDRSYFFDVFLPGYSDNNCEYYQPIMSELSTSSSLSSDSLLDFDDLILGNTIELLVIPPPRDFETKSFNFPSFL